MNQEELLGEVQRLEDDGYVVVLKWDGERSKGKKTLLISLPGTDLFIRRDSDDMWGSLESALTELRESSPSGIAQAEQIVAAQSATRSESDLEGDDKPKPESEGCSQ